MFKKILIVLAVIAAFYIAWVGGQAAYNNVIVTDLISPGDITISQVSNSKVDWVSLHNNLNRETDLGVLFLPTAIISSHFLQGQKSRLAKNCGSHPARTRARSMFPLINTGAIGD